MVNLNALPLLLLLTVAVGSAAAILAWRERPKPGSGPLVLMLVGQTWWSICLVFQIQAATLPGKVFWVNVSWAGVVVIPVGWLLFALEYTGQSQYVRPRYIAVLMVVPLLTVVFAMTGEFHSLLYTDSDLVRKYGTFIINRTPGLWFWVIAGYTYLLGLLGSLPLLSLVSSETPLFRGQSVSILIGTLAPWVSNVLYLGGAIPTAGLDPTPIAFSVSGVAYLAALTRFDLLETSPSPNRRARRIVFESKQEGIVVVDGQDHVVDLNESAEEIFETSRGEAIGNAAESLIPDYRDLPVEGSSTGHVIVERQADEIPFDVSVSMITNFQGQPIGRAITFHDISDHVRQQQRLEVLNRVFRHNIRNEVNLIFGHADLVGDGDVGQRASEIKRQAMHISEIGDKAREIIDLFDQIYEQQDEISLQECLERNVSAIGNEYPDVEIEYELPDPTVHIASMLEPVVYNVVENAAKHNSNDNPTVTIRVREDSDDVRIEVADNGPGIDEYERSVLNRGKETPLEHGSGLGLWLIKWGTEIADGRVSFHDNEPTGSVVALTVPVLS